jgi:hypothetical protein
MVVMMEISSADFMKLTLQEVADMLLDQEKHTALCKGLVDSEMFTLKVEVCKE